MAARVTRRRVIEEDNLGFLERCGGGLATRKEARRRRVRKRKSRGKGELKEGKPSKLCLRSPGMATMDLFDFLLYYC